MDSLANIGTYVCQWPGNICVLHSFMSLVSVDISLWNIITQNKEKIEKSTAKKNSQVKPEAKTAKAKAKNPAKESAGSKTAKKPAASNKKLSKED